MSADDGTSKTVAIRDTSGLGGMIMVEAEYLKHVGDVMAAHVRMKGFWNELVAYMFEHLELDGGTFEDLGVKYGLLEEVSYDPDIHGCMDVEPGDKVYINIEGG